MSLCPTADLHSVYLDGELPASFISKYEVHIASCPKCQKELNALRNLSSAFNADKTSILLDSSYLSQSYDRLKTKLRYSKTAKIIERTPPSFFNYAIKGLAAAAVLTFALLTPLLKGNKSSNKQASSAVAIKPITRPRLNPSLTSSDSNIFNNVNNVLYTREDKEYKNFPTSKDFPLPPYPTFLYEQTGYLTGRPYYPYYEGGSNASNDNNNSGNGAIGAIKGNLNDNLFNASTGSTDTYNFPGEYNTLSDIDVICPAFSTSPLPYPIKRHFRKEGREDNKVHSHQ